MGAARRQLGDNREPQFIQALLYIEADVARARGDLTAAAALVADGLSESTAWSARYAWPLIWLGARINADGAERARDRNAEARPTTGPWCRTRLLTGDIGTPSPAASAYRALTDAERHRGLGQPAADAWREALRAWEVAGDVWPLAYAQFRLAEALCDTGDAGRSGRAAPAAAATCRAARRTAAAGRRPGARPTRPDRPRTPRPAPAPPPSRPCRSA